MRSFSLFIFSCIICFCACRPSPSDNRDNSGETAFSLRLSPESGASYHYDISNTTETTVQLEGKEVENKTTTNTGMSYLIEKDTASNYIFTISYDKVKLYSKNNGVETDADAENAAHSLNAVDKMLGALKDAKLRIMVTPGKETKIISGYEELSAKLMSTLGTSNPNAKWMAQRHIDKVIKEGMIQKNIDQLFNIFPDSAIHKGDKWQIESRQTGDFNLNTNTSFVLKDLDDGKAFINAKSTLQSDNTPIAMTGYNVIPNLKGTQEGEYEMEATTGMLLNGVIKSVVKGNMQMAGREVPVEIIMNITIKAKRAK